MKAGIISPRRPVSRRINRTGGSDDPKGEAVALRRPFLPSANRGQRRKCTQARPPVRFHAKHVSVGESGGEYFQVSFDKEGPTDDDLDLSPFDQPYLLVQRSFEDEDGRVCYIETLGDTYTGHYRLRLIEFTPTRLAFEIARKDHKYVEVNFDLSAKRFNEVKRIVHIIFGVRA